jgi:FK506-binding protein 4/5
MENRIVDITGDGGVIKEVLHESTSTETPRSGDEVTVHYNGTLLDGTKFDSSRDRNLPYTFTLEGGKVIKGWDKAVATMRKGEIAKVILKPDYAYGKEGKPPTIPENATLVFEIELLSWDDEKDITKQKDGGVLKKLVLESDKWDSPNYEANCKVNMVVKGHNGHIYEDAKEKSIIIGSSTIPDGLQVALESMKVGEKSIFKIRADNAYGSTGNKELNIPPNTDLIYDIHLSSLEKGKETWQINKFSEKLEIAQRRKNEGNDLLAGNYGKLAIKKYEKSLDIFKNSSALSEEEKQKVKDLQLACHLNLAAVHLKEKNYKSAVEESTKALEIDAQNVKALWRRGNAYSYLSEFIPAQRDFDSALVIAPDNDAVKTSYNNCKKRMQAADKKDKKRFENLFERLREEEQKETSHPNPETPQPPETSQPHPETQKN